MFRWAASHFQEFLQEESFVNTCPNKYLPQLCLCLSDVVIVLYTKHSSMSYLKVAK